MVEIYLGLTAVAVYLVWRALKTSPLLLVIGGSFFISICTALCLAGYLHAANVLMPEALPPIFMVSFTLALPGGIWASKRIGSPHDHFKLRSIKIFVLGWMLAYGSSGFVLLAFLLVLSAFGVRIDNNYTVFIVLGGISLLALPGILHHKEFVHSLPEAPESSAKISDGKALQ